MYRYDKPTWTNFSRSANRQVRRSINSSGNASTIEIDFHPAYPSLEVDPLYMSLSLDISVLAGGFWWEGSKSVRRGLGVTRIPPLDLNQPKLDKYIAALAPFYLRIGGSEADKVSYLEESKQGGLTLGDVRWNQLQNLLLRHQLKLFFTAKYGVFTKQQHGLWDGKELEALLRYSRERQQQLDVVELGNELNAYWIFHGLGAQPNAKAIAQDYNAFANLVKTYYPNTRICGPGSAYWPKIGEAGAPFSNITRAFLQLVEPGCIDIIDWHYYPFQSRRSPLRTRTATLNAMMNPRSYNDFAKYTRRLIHWRDLYQPHTELWTGESGSAQCGGQQGLSDRWVSCFWWADQLGLGAQLGQKVMIRQSLVGGEYGLLDRLTLEPRPDYWLSFMWVNLMGNRAIPVYCEDQSLRVYCHTGKGGNTKTLLLINLSYAEKEIDCSTIGDVRGQYEMTAESLDSDTIYINAIHSSEISDHLQFSAIPLKEFSATIKAHSINFWMIDGASNEDVTLR